jgi:uncharacterized membrane protein
VTVDDSRIQHLERLLARLMLRGVQFSAVCLLIGLLLWVAGAAPDHSRRLLTLGLISLMATPMLRVAISVVEAIRLRDWFFILSTSVVAVLLSISVAYALLTTR